MRVCEYLQLHPFEFLDENAAFITVCYKDPQYHITVLLYRKNHPTINAPAMEYIDSMASLQNDAQNFLEHHVYEACAAQNVQYFGSKHMYNGITTNYFGDKYVFEPLQALEGLFTWQRTEPDFTSSSYKEALKPYGVEAMADSGRLFKYVESLKNFDGGNCILWNHHIAGELIQRNIGAYEWMVNFIAEYGTSPAAAARYSSQIVFASLGKCMLDPQRPKSNDDRKTCTWKPYPPQCPW